MPHNPHGIHDSVRSRLVGARTTLINQLRAILLERGTTAPQGRRKFEAIVEGLLVDPGLLPEGRIRRLARGARISILATALSRYAVYVDADRSVASFRAPLRTGRAIRTAPALRPVRVGE